MIDIHCHILPSVDDGAESLTAAVMMAAMAADDGQQVLVATPHVLWNPEYDPSVRLVHRQALEALDRELTRAGIPLKCLLGAEVLMDQSVAGRMEDFPRIQGTDYALVEFRFDAALRHMDRCLGALAARGIRPVVAHPERYFALHRDREHLRRWHQAGYCLQVNKGSFYGQFGWKEKRLAKWMLKHRLADFWATDAHDIAARTTRAARALGELERAYGRDYIQTLTRENPQKLLENIPLRPLKTGTASAT